MSQPSIGYACGRVGTLAKQSLTSAQVERLLMANTFQEASKTLVDIGVAVSDQDDFQTIADSYIEKACILLREISPCPNVTDCYLLRYDIHNVKVLIKSRELGVKPSFLSKCGTLPLEKLQHAVTERRYGTLPVFLSKALNDLEKQLAKQFSPMLVDTMLDQAMFEQVFYMLSKENSPTSVKYFKAKVDFHNTIILLRVKGMENEFAFFNQLFLKGGTYNLRSFALAFNDEVKISNLLRNYGENINQCLNNCVQDKTKLPVLEALGDDYLFTLFNKAKYQADSLDKIIRYLLVKQRESLNIRLIMTSKLNGFAPLEVQERVREMNG